MILFQSQSINIKSFRLDQDSNSRTWKKTYLWHALTIWANRTDKKKLWERDQNKFEKFKNSWSFVHFHWRSYSAITFPAQACSWCDHAIAVVLMCSHSLIVDRKIPYDIIWLVFFGEHTQVRLDRADWTARLACYTPSLHSWAHSWPTLCSMAALYTTLAGAPTRKHAIKCHKDPFQ